MSDMGREGTGTAHSKIILIGEHSVVYGYPAIAIPLKNIIIRCSVKSSDVPFSNNPENPLSVAVHVALQYLGKENEKMEYSVKSEIPEKRGMGSSAAVSIAGIRAVFDYFGKKPDDDVLEELVNKAETVAHDNPSGLDAKTCLSDKPIRFVRQKGFSYLDIALGGYIVIADSGIQGKTREAVMMVREMGEKAKPYLSRLGELSDKIRSHMKDKNMTDIGKSMTEAHKELSNLGLNIRETDMLVEEALKAGALGAKMSGGGLGGCVISLAENYKKAEKIRKVLEEKGAVNTWIENL